MNLYGQKTKMGLGIKVSFYFFVTFGFSSNLLRLPWPGLSRCMTDLKEKD